MKRAWQITLNEVRLYLIDKGDLAFGLLLPILTFALMYGAFGGQTTFNATATVVDEDNGVYSQQLIQQIDAVDGVSITLETPERAQELMDRANLNTAFFIPAGFSAALESGQPTQITVKQRGNGGQEGQILVSIVDGVVGQMNQGFQARSAVQANLAGKDISDARINAVVDNILNQERQDPVVSITENYAPGTGSTSFVDQFLPGIITMYVLFSLTLIARTLVEERQRGTLERLLTTRLSVSELFFGKFISIIARGFVQTLILVILAWAVFQIFTPLSFVYTLIIAIVFSAAAAGIGIIIASISRTDQGANWIAVVVTMFMAMVGGTFFEISQGGVLDTMSRFSLNRYANDAMQTVITQGGNLADAWQPLAILAGVAVAGLIIGRLIFKAVPGSK